MRIRALVTGSLILVLLAAGSLQLGAAPTAQAQQTCPAGQTYCPSGAYAGQCRSNTVTCPAGSVSATVGGCSTCSCPGGQIVCGGACQATRTCSDPNRATTDQCTGACGACTGDLSLDATTNTCVETIVKLAPTSTQERSSATPTINVVQKGSGLLFNLQAQSGADGATRRQIISVDKSGLMVGYDPDAAKLGIDLSAAGGQNLLYAVARAAGLDAALDSLLKLQVKEADGAIRDRFRVDGIGNIVAAGSVRGSQLCIGVDCKSSWSAVAPAGVLLQGTTPGIQQTGNLNVSGTARLGSLAFAERSTVNLQNARVANATYIGWSGEPTAPPFLRFTESDLVYVPTGTRNGSGLMVWESAVDPTMTGYAKLWHDGTSTYVGDTTNSAEQSLRINGPDVVVPGNETVGSLTLAAGGTVNLQNGDVLRADTISAGATATSTPYIDFDTGLRMVPSTNNAGLKVEAWPGLNLSPNPYARLWHNGTSVILNDNEANAVTGIQLDGSNLTVSGALDVAGGIQAGSGNVNIIDATGRIPAITPTHFTSLTGTLLTGLNASNLALGTVPDARLPAGLLRNPIDGGASSVGPWLTIQGGGSILQNVALRLYDTGTAEGNMSTLEFAHNNGSGPTSLASVKSVNVGANGAGGAKLVLSTASNNTGSFNTDQLVLRPDGDVRVEKDLSLGGGDVRIEPGEYLTIRAPNGDPHLGGLARLRVGGIAISDNPNVTVPTRGLSVQHLATFGSVTVDGSATFNGNTTVDGRSVLRGRSVVTSTCATITCSASCASGYAVISGGCSTGDGTIRRSFPATYTQWTCERTSSANTMTAYAICTKL